MATPPNDFNRFKISLYGLEPFSNVKIIVFRIWVRGNQIAAIPKTISTSSVDYSFFFLSSFRCVFVFVSETKHQRINSDFV